LPARHTELAEVGFAVNDARNDGPECLEPPTDDQPAAAAQPATTGQSAGAGQQALF
jgi:hypothetical protein